MVESALDEDLDPYPCEEDEEFFKSRPNAEEMEQAISKFLDGSLKTSMTWNVLPWLIEIIICQVRQASGIHPCSS